MITLAGRLGKAKLNRELSILVIVLLSLASATGSARQGNCQGVIAATGIREIPIVVDGPAPEISRSTLKTHLQEAASLFSTQVLPFHEPIVATVGGDGLRTGYNFKQRKLLFPKIENVKDYGVESADVVFHESFHFMLCAVRPFLCTDEAIANPEVTMFHEVFADMFAYFVRRDTAFGEDYFKDRPYMRKYFSGSILGLTDGEHAKANAILSVLLEEGIAPREMSAFLSEVQTVEDFSIASLARANPKIAGRIVEDAGKTAKIAPLNYPESKLQRYRVSPNDPLKLVISLSESLAASEPGLEVKVVDESLAAVVGAEVKTTGVRGEFSVTIAVAENSPSRKLVIVFVNGDRLLGTKPIYISVKTKK